MITTGWPTLTDFSRSASLGLENSPEMIERISTNLRENQINTYRVITPASSTLVSVTLDEEKLPFRVRKQIAKEES